MSKKWANDWKIPEYAGLRCLYHTRLIIPAHVSGASQDYEFEPDQVNENVKREDAPLLLAMRSKSISSCCGGIASQPQPYFEEV